MTPTLLARNMAEHALTIESLYLLGGQVEQAAQTMAKSLLNGGKLMLCGNGGSASDAQHFAAEMMGRFLQDRHPYAAIALATDTSVLTCIANDYAYDQVFARQIQGLGRSGDVLIALSTSGNSENVVQAALQAKAMGVCVLGLMGGDGGLLNDICDLALVVSSANTARIQEAHILLIHTLCELIEQHLKAETSVDENAI
jgi:D-sedoheptulose 7-phosphate isomerase